MTWCFTFTIPPFAHDWSKATDTNVSDETFAAGRDLGRLFEHFVSHDARACAISLPPDFAPSKVSEGRVATALENILAASAECDERDRRALSHFVFWTLAEYCAEYRLPFDLMIGVNRGVYAAGVFQGQDLYDSRVSLIQYRELFNAFPQVTFPVSVLASVTNQELASYAWIFPNVVTSGHWWYSNTPAFIEHDLATRLEAVPRTKQIGYYSDMYKLEFGLAEIQDVQAGPGQGVGRAICGGSRLVGSVGPWNWAARYCGATSIRSSGGSRRWRC